MTRKKVATAIKFPTFRSDCGKTPASDLWVCDRCRNAEWFVPGYGQTQNVRACAPCRCRMRAATVAEKAQAVRSLKLWLNKEN